jgi:hypothetical protein
MNYARLVQSVDQKICGRQSFTISELSCGFPQISRTFPYEIITVWLGYHKFCARWVPKMLMGAHKLQRMTSALTFLSHTTKMAMNFSITSYELTGDKTWVSSESAETKEQSIVKALAAHTFPKQSDGGIHATGDHNNIRSEMYCKTLKKLHRAIQNKRR